MGNNGVHDETAKTLFEDVVGLFDGVKKPATLASRKPVSDQNALQFGQEDESLAAMWPS